MNPFAARRARLASQMQPGAVAVLQTAPEVLRNADSEYLYRHDSYFYYLSGFTEPESVVAIVAARGELPARSILFCREKNIEHETWTGVRYGPEGAREKFGFDEAYAIGELDAQMARLLADCPGLYYPLARGGELDERVARWLKAVRAQGRAGTTAPASTHDVLRMLDEMRLIKDDAELATMQRAADISGGAHARAMRMARPGMWEYEIEAELLHEFRRHGAQYPAYTPIVAAGANSCILHYNTNNAQVKDGDLVLIDAGCELDSYASDITRTWPANGCFSGPQKALYELVLAAQQAAFEAVAPGRQYSDFHNAALSVLTQGMLDLGLIAKDKHANVEDAISARAYQQFYMHGTGHWLGLDVHDVGQYRDTTLDTRPSRALQPGMVLTVEPGIYVRPAEGVPPEYWNIGIRIEDDVVVTADGSRVLTGSAPRQVDEIEALMRDAR
jgi:Xaa-Pro aminopeptidase